MSDSPQHAWPLGVSLPFCLPNCLQNNVPVELQFPDCLGELSPPGPSHPLTPPQLPRLGLNITYLGKPSSCPEFLEAENSALILHHNGLSCWYSVLLLVPPPG